MTGTNKPEASMRLVIPRDEWLRGKGSAGSYLLRDYDGKRCCLGIYGRALGIPDEALMGNTEPRFVEHPAWPKWLFRGKDAEAVASFELMSINDCETTPEPERERLIASRFAEHGIDVVFVDTASEVDR